MEAVAAVCTRPARHRHMRSGLPVQRTPTLTPYSLQPLTQSIHLWQEGQVLGIGHALGHHHGRH